MDGRVIDAAQRLQRALDATRPDNDRDTLVWAHGFLTVLLKTVEARVPDLITSTTLLQSSRAALDDLYRKVGERPDPDSLLDIIREQLGGADDAPVPARRKPGPKGLRGGAAVPLPPSEDLPM